jgi:hypothetical protein
MYYRLLGFSQSGSSRQFSFQQVAIGASPMAFAVIADVLLAQKLNVRLQDLPSLCSRLLYAAGDHPQRRALTVTEADMLTWAAETAAAAAETAGKHARRSERAALASAARSARGNLEVAQSAAIK